MNYKNKNGTKNQITQYSQRIQSIFILFRNQYIIEFSVYII